MEKQLTPVLAYWAFVNKENRTCEVSSFAYWLFSRCGVNCDWIVTRFWPLLMQSCQCMQEGTLGSWLKLAVHSSAYISSLIHSQNMPKAHYWGPKACHRVQECFSLYKFCLTNVTWQSHPTLNTFTTLEMREAKEQEEMREAKEQSNVNCFWKKMSDGQTPLVTSLVMVLVGDGMAAKTNGTRHEHPQGTQ